MSFGESMESKIQQVGKATYAVIGPEGATNFGIVKAQDGSAILIDADIDPFLTGRWY